MLADLLAAHHEGVLVLYQATHRTKDEISSVVFTLLHCQYGTCRNLPSMSMPPAERRSVACLDCAFGFASSLKLCCFVSNVSSKLTMHPFQIIMPSQATLKRKGNNRKEQQSAPNARFRSTSSPSDSAVMARKDARVFKKPRTEAPRSTDLVPEFDMRRLQSNDETLRRLAAKRFWELLKDRGAVWVRRHSIATEKIEQAFEWVSIVSSWPRRAILNDT